MALTDMLPQEPLRGETRDSYNGPVAENDAASRRRVKRACDHCHHSRARCDAANPCRRCAESALPCSYNRTSRRRGRIPRSKPLPMIERSNSNSGLETTNGHRASPLSRSNDAGSYDHLDGVAAVNSSWFGAVEPNNDPNIGHNTGPESHALDFMLSQTPVTTIAFPDWLMDAWSQPVSPMMDPLASRQGVGADRASCQQSARPHIRTDGVHGSSPDQIALNPRMETNSMRSNSSSRMRYPVLDCLHDHLQQNISPVLACDLLDSYFTDTSPGSCLPASPLVIAHLFRRSSFLSLTNTRPCSPALLSSMLLVASATTEAPFFGASPSARSRLMNQLFELTLQLLNHPHSTKSTHLSSLPSSKPGRNRFVEEVATYLHLALVSMTVELDSFPSRWWHTAFQLAKEYRLNADIVTRAKKISLCEDATRESPEDEDDGLSPNYSTCEAPSPFIDLRGSMVIDRTDFRFAHATKEEMEERRRLWWTLFLWDKQLSLSYNSSVCIPFLECCEVQTPMSETLWQEAAVLDDCIDPKESLTFKFFVNFGRALEMLLTRHQSLLRTKLGDCSGCDIGLQQAIKRQLGQLAQFVRNDSSTSISLQSTLDEHAFSRYSTLLVRILFLLEARQWDMSDALAGPNVSPNQLAEDTSNNIRLVDEAATALSDLLSMDPDFTLSPTFCDVFLFLGSAITYVILSRLQEHSTPRLIAAAETFVRALESIISTTRLEHPRKMRRLLLMALAKAKWRTTPTLAERTLRQHITQTYRWSICGNGLRA